MLEQGFPVPKAYLDKPELSPELLEYEDAFWILNTSRTIGFDAIGYIPLTEIEAFCRLFPVLDVPKMVSIIRHMDRLFVDFHNEKRKASAKGK